MWSGCRPGEGYFLIEQFSLQENGSGNYDQSDCLMSPGELVIQSGIYEICHQDEPRVKVLLVRNSIFPFCRRCGEQVRYKLLQAAPHISEDPDFLECASESDIRRSTNASPSVSPVQLGFTHGFRYSQDNVQARRETPEGRNL